MSDSSSHRRGAEGEGDQSRGRGKGRAEPDGRYNMGRSGSGPQFAASPYGVEPRPRGSRELLLGQITIRARVSEKRKRVGQEIEEGIGRDGDSRGGDQVVPQNCRFFPCVWTVLPRLT